MLLATSSLAALVLGWGGGAAAAPCVVNPATPYTNNGAINCVTFNDNATHTGDVVKVIAVPNRAYLAGVVRVDPALASQIA